MSVNHNGPYKDNNLSLIKLPTYPIWCRLCSASVSAPVIMYNIQKIPTLHSNGALVTLFRLDNIHKNKNHNKS